MINWTFAREVGLPKWAWRTALRQLDKRVRRRDSRLVLPTGGTIMLDRGSSSAGEVFVTDADMDWGAEALFARFADPAGDLFDVGAHIGYYSLYLAPLCRRVFAFEADPRNAVALADNACAAGNVEPVACAVSSASGTLRLAAGGNRAVSRVAAEGDAVAAVSLDDFAAATDCRPALIKVDVEGHDLAVLEGARAVIARWQPLVLTEFTQGDGDNDLGRLLRLVEDVGYQPFATVWRPGGGWWRARRRTLARVDADLFARERVKMIFLVPPRLQPAFAALVGTAA